MSEESRSLRCVAIVHCYYSPDQAICISARIGIALEEKICGAPSQSAPATEGPAQRPDASGRIRTQT
jgi:hypothetical protein